MKILKKISSNILFPFTLFLLAFIPLYPKRPLLDIQHTWVYIRLEDFAVVFVLLIWVVLILLKKITLKTPLTLPVLIFWIIGGLSTLHGVLLIFPTLSDVFSNVALLSYLRRIEYISLFFIAFASIKDKKSITYVVATLAIVLLLVVGYGLGQKFLGFPAFLTMNEEFAKGVPIQLSDLSRVPSTFAGHYDLAAYLVLIVPLLTSMAFGFKNWLVKISLLGTAALGLGLLFMTVSRVSMFVLLLSMVILLILQKKRIVLISLVVLTIVFLTFSPRILQRFGSTVTEVNVLVDAKTGDAIGQVKDVPASYFENKVVYKEFISGAEAVQASSSAILSPLFIPAQAYLLIEANNPTGENLPQGTGYINLPLSPVIRKLDQYFFERTINQAGSESAQARVYYGDFLVKKALAYDLSFTTRFQGEWPRTIDAFKRNIFLGSGYGSVSLAVDNNYLRILGELGLFGFISFFSIFIIAGLYIKRIFPSVDSPIVRSFVLGFVAGSFGLALNAVLIDVFEASKIAFSYWLLMGITIGVLHLYKKEEIDVFKEFKSAITSTSAVICYLFIITFALFSSAYNYYFVGDDFTWFRWVSECSNGFFKNGLQQCYPFAETVIRYFTESNGFFYRPGTKLYFLLMHSAFWLNPTVYHFVSIFLHFSIAVVLFLLFKKVIKDYFLAIVSVLLFLVLSGHSEAIFWISSTGLLFNALFTLVSLLFFIYWKEKKRILFLVISLTSAIFSLLFHELGVIVPLLIILYDAIFGEKLTRETFLQRRYYLWYFFPLLPYFILRLISQSHWFNGDYSYNLLKLPFNIVGNTIGYLGLSLFGPASLSFYETLRNISREHLVLAIPASLVILFVAWISYKKIMQILTKDERKIVLFGILFFLICLIPFLGLGNITSRYSYLSSAGFVILFSIFLKKIYEYLVTTNGRYITTMSVAIVAIVFFSMQLFQLQRVESDWKSAGEKSKKFLVSLNQMYTDYWTNEEMKFYFVNVPIHSGEAWVFPVGLNDAVWFAFRNEKIGVYQLPTIEQAFNTVQIIRNEKVFEFDESGAVLERIKPPVSTAIPVK